MGDQSENKNSIDKNEKSGVNQTATPGIITFLKIAAIMIGLALIGYIINQIR